MESKLQGPQLDAVAEGGSCERGSEEPAATRTLESQCSKGGSVQTENMSIICVPPLLYFLQSFQRLETACFLRRDM